MSDTIFMVRESGPVLAREVSTFLLARGGGFDSNPDIALNTAHREGDGSDHADVASNNAHRADVTTNPHAVTADQAGADPAGSAAAVQGNLDTHEGRTDNPHVVTAAQLAEDVYDNGVITVDTVLDLNNGAVQVVTMGAIANLSVIGWEALAPLDDGKAQAATLIIVDGDLFAPTFDSVNQGPLPTYTAGFACVQELASLGPDGDIYNMWQVSNDQHVLLGPGVMVNGDFSNWTGDDPDNWAVTEVGDPTSNVTEDVNGCRVISDGTLTQLSQNSAVNGKDYLCEVVVASGTGAMKLSVGGVTIVGSFNSSFSVNLTAAGADVTLARAATCDVIINSITLRRLF